MDASAPGARTVRRTTARVRLTRLPALPLPRIENVRTRRLTGGRVEVRWTTTGPATGTLLSVRGLLTRRDDSQIALEALWGAGRRSYRAVLRDAADARWVRVEILELVGRERRSVTVRLR